jgi:hypothetical protein
MANRTSTCRHCGQFIMYGAAPSGQPDTWWHSGGFVPCMGFITADPDPVMPVATPLYFTATTTGVYEVTTGTVPDFPAGSMVAVTMNTEPKDATP